MSSAHTISSETSRLLVAMKSQTRRACAVLHLATLGVGMSLRLDARGVPYPRLWLVTNLVDPASSHMLVSKIKPCMSQYKLLYGETANGSLKQL